MLIYDGFDFSDYLLVTDIQRPILPPQKLSTTTIMGKAGAYFLRKQHEPITIPVEIKVYPNHDMSYRELTRFLSGKLNKSDEKQIIFKDEADRHINGILDGSTELENAVKTGEGTLNFYCSDPFYYKNDDEVFTFNKTGSHDYTREHGNTDSFPLIKVTGKNSGGTITLETDDTKLIFDGALSSGDELYFDSEHVTSYILKADGSKSSANNNINTMVFPITKTGANNLTISVSGGATIDEVAIYCHSRWT